MTGFSASCETVSVFGKGSDDYASRSEVIDRHADPANVTTRYGAEARHSTSTSSGGWATHSWCSLVHTCAVVCS